MMRKRIIEKSCFILLGFIISALFFSFLLDKEKNGKTPKELASVELDLRMYMKTLSRNYDVKMGLIRESDSIVLRVWDKGLFPINDWRLSRGGASFVEDLVSTLGKIKESPKITINSHYDSISPIKKGDGELNKIKISNYRAAQIANIFAHKGFDPNRISYRGLSDKAPVVKDRDVFGNYIDEAGDMNRRVDIKIEIAGAYL